MTVLMPSWYYEKKDLKRSPSVQDGIDIERENRYRREGARFIATIGTKLGLRYDTIATGVVYFHRFYMFHSFRTFPRYVTACCCLFLAGKVEETPKKCKDVIKVAKAGLTESQFAQFGDDPKEEVMTLERILLQTIKFDLQVDHPYGHLLKYAKYLKDRLLGDKDKLEKTVQMAWTFINDSFCTTLCLQWEPEIIAIALMYLAGKLSKFEVVDWKGRLPKHTCWWDMFVEGMSLELLEDICHQVLDLYSMPLPSAPQDSPPATPPTKSTRKVQPPSPVSVATSPVPPKVKEVPVGQPIPRLEPGELKRKTSKPLNRKDIGDAKVPRSSSASSQGKSGQPVNSPAKPVIEPDIKAPVETTSNSKQSNPIQTIDSTYKSGKGQYSVTVTTSSEQPKPTLSSTVVSTASYTTTSQTTVTHYLPYGQPIPTYYADGSQPHPPVQQVAYSQAPHFPNPPPGHMPGPPSTNVLPSAQAQPPPPPHQFAEIYGSQSLSSAHVPPPPHQSQYTAIPNNTNLGQYSTPLHQPVGSSVVLPNSSLPPPPSNLSQPPPLPVNPGLTSMPAPIRHDIPRLSHSPNVLPPGAGAPPPMPSGLIQPPPHMVLRDSGSVPPMPVQSHYASRPESNVYASEARGSIDHRGNMVSEPLLSHGHMSYMHDEYRGHYERERLPPPYFRNKRNDDFSRERYLEDEYGPHQRHSYGPEFEPNMLGPPPRRFNLDHHAPRKRGPPLPMMKNTRPEVPTGIPPVRITGRY